MTKPIVFTDPTYVDSTPHDLLKLLKNLNKESPEAIEVLVNLMHNSKNETIKLRAVELLLNMQKDISASINRDTLQKLIVHTKVIAQRIADIREVGGEDSGEESGGRPMKTLNFNEIVEVS